MCHGSFRDCGRGGGATDSRAALSRMHSLVGELTEHHAVVLLRTGVALGHATVATRHAAVATGHAAVATGHAAVATGHAGVVPGHAGVVPGHADPTGDVHRFPFGGQLKIPPLPLDSRPQ